MNSSIRKIATPSATMPLRNSSPDTLGPTTEVLEKVTWAGASTVRSRWVTAVTVWAGSAPAGVWNFTSTAPAVPKVCTSTSPRRMALRAARTAAASTGLPGVATSTTVPPLKSMPSVRPWVKQRASEPITATIDRKPISRATPTKCRLVLAGSRRIRGQRSMGRALSCELIGSAGSWA